MDQKTQKEVQHLKGNVRGTLLLATVLGQLEESATTHPDADSRKGGLANINDSGAATKSSLQRKKADSNS